MEPAPHRINACEPRPRLRRFDNDGDVDVVIINLNEPPSLLRNDVSGQGHWLKVLLEGVKSNRSAIGGRASRSMGDGRTHRR